ncbi:acyl transferase/acyl hydrolase/lysophospholipase, partial [Rhizoctonia solani]
GGGIRGLSSLLVLQEFMLRVESANDGQQLHPHEQFDMIAGTGTGGISACMLARLKMPVQKAIEEYIKIMESVFTEKKSIGSTVYKGTKLKEALRAMVRDATGDENSKISETQTDNGSKTLVFAMAKHNLNASLPVLFRSYTVTANRGPDCAIWEALYATMAHPSLFKSIKISDSSSSQEFVGGELGCSNPIAHVLSEVKRVYPGRQVACVISIGAGHSGTIKVPEPGLKQLVLRTEDVVVMKDMAIDSERVAEEMALRFQDIKDVYFRFNVDQDMQGIKAGNWERREEVAAHTSSYLQKSETNQKLGCAVLAWTLNAPTLVDGHILDLSAKRPTGLKRCPAPTSIYTGREMQNTQVATCITGSIDERRVCVVYGMGGAGKTQLVLNVIEHTRDEWDHVIFVDASSKESIEQTLEEFAVMKGIGGTYEATLHWLEDSRERWLVVFDNADTPSINIRQYLPGGRHGSIAITTRLFDLTGLAKGPGCVCRLSGMRQADGLALIIKAARLVDQYIPDEEMEAAEMLLKVTILPSLTNAEISSCAKPRTSATLHSQSSMLAHLLPTFLA